MPAQPEPRRGATSELPKPASTPRERQVIPVQSIFAWKPDAALQGAIQQVATGKRQGS